MSGSAHRRKRPVVAFLLTLLLPGLGAFYAGARWSAAAMLAITVLCTIVYGAAPDGPLVLLPIAAWIAAVIQAEQATRRANRLSVVR
jgi:hypothetical protein